MKSIKRLLQKDKFGLVRGTLALGFMLLLIVFLALGVLGHRDSLRAEERAANAVRQVAQQFELLLEDGFRQMDVVSEEIGADAGENRILISNMVRYGVFSDAMLVADGVEYHLDGSEVAVAQSLSRARYQEEERADRVVTGTGGAVQLHVYMQGGAELTAWLDPERLDKTLSNAFEEDYDYCIFNTSSGAYLINHSPYGGSGYFDALLKLDFLSDPESLLHADVAQARVKSSADSGEFYIAQTDTSVHPFSIALFIPEEVLAQEGEMEDPLRTVAIVVLLLLILVLTVYAASIMRRLKAESSEQQRRARISEKVLALSAEVGKAVLYIYRRKSDEVLIFCDGMKLDEDAAAPKNLMELAKKCGLGEADAEQLQDRMRDLKVGERRNLNLICTARDGKHLLRFALSCPEDEKDLVIGTVHDFTMEQQAEVRLGDEQNFRRMILPKAIAIWQINLSRGRWKMTDCRTNVNLKQIGITLGEWREYDTDLNNFVRSYLHPKDYREFIDKMSAEEILDMYSRGRAEQTLEYRFHDVDAEDHYLWYRQVVRVYKNPDNGEILANLYLLNVDAEKNAEIERTERTRILQQTLTALGGIYDGLYYVDLDADLCYAARTHGNELITQLSTPFKSTFAGYIDQNVHPEDREALRKLLDPYSIRKNIREGSHLMRCKYRRGIGDDYEWSSAIVQAARFENGTVREIVIALRNINEEK